MRDPARPAPLQRLRNGLLGLLYPRVCVGCEAGLGPSGETWLCPGCRSRLHPLRPPRCERCGQAYEGRLPDRFHCSNCADLDLRFDFAVSAYRAEGLARELVHRFKYGRQHHLCVPLGEWLGLALEDARLAEAEEEGWLLAPVPLHPSRHREREFNQAAELCRVFRRRHPGFALAHPLRRIRATARQARLDRADRLRNLEGAFRLARRHRRRGTVRGRPVVLVDDVLTTGATASECARVLKDEGGASMVVVMTPVRG